MSEYPLFGVDYSFARPDPAWMVAHGVGWVYRYLHSGAGPAAALTAPELASLRAHGLPVVTGYEETGRELLGGYSAGVRIAQTANALQGALMPAQPIIVNADFGDPSPTVMEQYWPAVSDALRGVNSVIGVQRTGLYAGYWLMKWAFDAGLIAYGMQTYAWSHINGASNPVVWDPRAQIQQYNNGQWAGSVDFDRAMVPDFGQNPTTYAPAGGPTEDGMDMWTDQDSANLAAIAHFTARHAYGVYYNTDTNEWTLGGTDFGKSLPQFVGTGGAPYCVALDADVNEYAGFLATGNPTIGQAWDRAYAGGNGSEAARVSKPDYVAIQRELSRVACVENPRTTS